MSIHQQYENAFQLETIQECEEDEAEKGEDEREEEDEAEDQREEEKGESEEEQLKVMRPGRLSISLVLDDTLTQERITDHSDPGPTTPRTPEDFCVNVSPPRAPRSGLERACCEGSEADGGIKVKKHEEETNICHKEKTFLVLIRRNTTQTWEDEKRTKKGW
ncbi:proline-, glutamic acid- and leucine-rich protein 1-like isoform X3 [Osmerus eperlanus]|uniref:proline-, glutamic acid- and leucine-rich protein 1-like isoform X3 n=1 Tax=Osmerus eperlanus TaxID=29151 RepID=UPI002E103A83